MRIIVNGAEHDVAAPGHETLLTTLRDRLDLTGTKLVCGRGECGACTVLIDRVSAYSCLTLTAACADRSITTVEGLANGDTLNRVQAAFIEHDALQCGYCTPGQVLALKALLLRNAQPSDEEIERAMSGNLCRCGAYPKILAAARALAGRPS
jgi:aerobic-type carbon monoxide dehydrogenase small subunit (CoxS/CutS family)